MASARIGSDWKKRGFPKTGSRRIVSDLLASDTKRHQFGTPALRHLAHARRPANSGIGVMANVQGQVGGEKCIATDDPRLKGKQRKR